MVPVSGMFGACMAMIGIAKRFLSLLEAHGNWRAPSSTSNADIRAIGRVQSIANVSNSSFHPVPLHRASMLSFVRWNRPGDADEGSL